MALFEISCEHSIIDVVFAPDGSEFKVLHQRGIDTYALETKDNRCLRPRNVRKETLDRNDKDMYEKPILQFAYSPNHGIHTLSVAERLLSSSGTSSPEPNNGILDGQDARVDAESVSCLSLYAVGDNPRIFAEEHSGRLLQVLPDGSTAPLPVSFPTYLPWVEIVDHDGELLALGLSRGGHLYVNSRQLVKNCTSFLVTPSHLIFTTSNHLLKFIHLDSPEGMLRRLPLLPK
jgi:elongator complex protein 1